MTVFNIEVILWNLTAAWCSRGFKSRDVFLKFLVRNFSASAVEPYLFANSKTFQRRIFCLWSIWIWRLAVASPVSGRRYQFSLNAAPFERKRKRLWQWLYFLMRECAEPRHPGSGNSKKAGHNLSHRCNIFKFYITYKIFHTPIKNWCHANPIVSWWLLNLYSARFPRRGFSSLLPPLFSSSRGCTALRCCYDILLSFTVGKKLQEKRKERRKEKKKGEEAGRVRRWPDVMLYSLLIKWDLKRSNFQPAASVISPCFPPRLYCTPLPLSPRAIISPSTAVSSATPLATTAPIIHLDAPQPTSPYFTMWKVTHGFPSGVFSFFFFFFSFCRQEVHI